MSLHVALSPEAKRRLRLQRLRSAISSSIIAMLGLVLLGSLLALICLEAPESPSKPLTGYAISQMTISEPPLTRPADLTPQSKPSPPNHRSLLQLPSRSIRPLVVEIPEFDPSDASAHVEASEDFGLNTNWGTGRDRGKSQGGFGKPGSIPGMLTGRLYDFKQKPDGQLATDYLANPRNQYIENIKQLQRRKFSNSALKAFFTAPTELSISHLGIPFTAASEGPKFFDAADQVEPSGWIAHYQGIVEVPESGRYRLVGMGDDYLAVLINQRPRLIAAWSDIHDEVKAGWQEGRDSHSWKSPMGKAKLVTGDWMNLRKGQRLQIDIGVSERPGGMVGFILMIQKDGERYRQGPDGRPILPLFTTLPFDLETRLELEEKFGSYELEWQKVPVFTTAQ